MLDHRLNYTAVCESDSKLEQLDLVVEGHAQPLILLRVAPGDLVHGA